MRDLTASRREKKLIHPLVTVSLNVTLFNLYFLDSHAYAQTLSPWGKKSAYDWIKADQYVSKDLTRDTWLTR